MRPSPKKLHYVVRLSVSVRLSVCHMLTVNSKAGKHRTFKLGEEVTHVRAIVRS